MRLPYDKEVMEVSQMSIPIMNGKKNSHGNLSDNEKRIVNYINEHSQISRKEVESLLNISKDASIRMLNKMIEKNILEKKDSTRKLIYLIKRI